MRRAVLIGLALAGLLCIAGIATAAVAAKRERTTDCPADAAPERCANHARLRAYCAEHPDDARHCQSHDASTDARRHCAHHPDDARCQAHSDRQPRGGTTARPAA